MGPPKVNKIGKYEVLDVIGRGGMGLVYKAIDPTIGRMVAIKKVTAVFSDDPDLLKRFYREAQSTGKLQHPNIVTLHDLGDQDGVPYLVMEYLEGDSLEKVIKERRPYTLAEKLNIIIQVCDGLGYAHQRQIVHRDVKPGNVVVLKDGGVKIVDFGIAQLGNERFTRTGQVVGSLYYMSPEQIQDADIDARSDIYSTGVVLFEFLSGGLPFQGKDPTSTLAKILHDPPPTLEGFLRSYPPELDAVVQRALSKNRDERYTSMEDFAFDLQSVQEKLSRDLIAGYLRSAEVCMKTREWDKAREHLRQVLKFDKQHRRANELLREVQIQIQKQQISDQVAQLRLRADQALGARQWDQALTLLDQAVRLDGTNSELIEFRNSVRRSSTLLADALRRAELAHSDGDLDAAKLAVEEALHVDPSDTTAKALNAILSKQIAERSKRKKIEDFVSGARKEIALRHFTSALDLLQKAEAIDASAAEVHQLIRSATAGREQERQRRALEEACAEIEDLLNRDEYAAACTRADDALQQFPQDLGLLKLRGFAEKQRDAWNRRLFIEAQMTAARQLLDAGQLIRAQGVLNEALERFSDDSGLISLLAMVSDGISRHEAQRREAERQAAEKRRYLTLQISAAAELQRSGQTVEALKKLRDAQRHYPESDELKSQIAILEDLLAREEDQRQRAQQEAQRRRAEIEKEIAASRQLLGAKQTNQAVFALEQALLRYPESEELRSQLEFIRRRVAVEQAERERAEQEARRQRAEIEREIARAQQLMDSRQANRAVANLEEILLRYPGSEELKSQLEFARNRLATEKTERERFEKEARHNQEEIEKEIAKARQLLDSNQASRALAVLQEALRRYPENESLRSESDVVQGLVAAEQARREKAEQEARRRRLWIESEITSTRQLLDSNEASRAVTTLEQALRQYPDAEELKTQLEFARRRVAIEQAERERAEREVRLKQEEIEREIAKAWQLLDAKQTRQAMMSLEQAVRRFPESKELKSQLDLATERFTSEEAEKERIKQEALHKRTEIEREIASARQLSDANQTGRAVALLEQAVRRYPDSEELKSQLAAAQQRLAVEREEKERAEQEARRWQAEIDKEIALARQLLNSGQTAQAVQSLEQAVRRLPPSRELEAQLDLASQTLDREKKERAAAEEQAARRSSEIESQIRTARRRLESNQTADAVAALEPAVQKFPESAQLASLLATAQQQLKLELAELEKAAREAQARRANIVAALENAKRLLKENQTSQACGALEEALRQYPESEELRTQLAASREKLVREQADREEAEKRRVREPSSIAESRRRPSKRWKPRCGVSVKTHSCNLFSKAPGWRLSRKKPTSGGALKRSAGPRNRNSSATAISRN
jgi:serine/threonine-protein kinase